MSVLGPLVDPAWLEPRLGERSLRVFDVSVVSTPPARQGQPWDACPARAEWEAAHIPGAGFIDLVHELSDSSSSLAFALPAPAALAAAFARHGVGDDDHVVFYDAQGGQSAARAWWLLRFLGHEAASVLDGGWRRWLAEGRPVSAEAPAGIAPGDLRARPRPERFASLERVREVVADGSAVLVNALSRSQWDGSEISSFARPGQIPGSVGAPASALVDPETHRLLPLAELDERLSEIADDDREIIVYCGAGVSATKVALALELVGRHDRVSVYDGSLGEWTAEPRLPLGD
jgi:thiosulfate/3-mercaptopyruvate sulfurtransferase